MNISQYNFFFFFLLTVSENIVFNINFFWCYSTFFLSTEISLNQENIFKLEQVIANAADTEFALHNAEQEIVRLQSIIDSVGIIHPGTIKQLDMMGKNNNNKRPQSAGGGGGGKQKNNNNNKDSFKKAKR